MSGDLLALADRLDAAEIGDKTLRFSECVVPGKRGYEWGAIMTAKPPLIRLLCDVWNARHEIAAALRARAA